MSDKPSRASALIVLPLTRTTLLATALAAACVAGSSALARHLGDGPTVAMPGALTGKVIHVADGDTLTLLDTQGYKRVIRLTDIDAPERAHGAGRPGQPYSAKAKAYLKAMTLGKQADANCYDIDARRHKDGTVHERYICRVFVNGTDTNMAMIDAGLAMANRQNGRYVRDPVSFEHEAVAKAAGKGIWVHGSPVSPWQWRRAMWQHRSRQKY